MKGQSLIELLVAIALVSVLMPALLTGFISSREGKVQQDQKFQATLLLKEAQEVVRIVRDNSWNSFAVNGIFHPSTDGQTWILALGSETLNGFTRQIVISDAYRDASGNLVANAGFIDPSTKKITVSVSWNSPFPFSISSVNYLTRHTNRTYTETTVADFEAGTKQGVAITNKNGGEVALGAGGRGDWCKPNLSIASVDLPKQGVANAITAIEGQVSAGTGENASGVSFANVSISNPSYPTPPQGMVAGTFDGYKTNDVFGETNYAYLATDNHSKEVVIIDLTQKDQDNKYQEVGYFNAPGNGSGESVYVLGNIGFMTTSNKLYTFDLSQKTGSQNQLGNVTLAGEGKRIVAVGSYAYVAIDSETTQMQIIDVSNPNNLAVVGQASVVGEDGESLFVNQTATRAYLVTESSDKKEFFIIDVSTKTGNRSTLGSFETNGMDPKGVTVATGNKAIVVGRNGEEYQVVDIATESTPSRCGGLNIDTGVNGIAMVLEQDGDAYAYIITGDASGELKILEGGPGGQYASMGTFESQTFDAVSAAMFNNFSATVTKPPSTDIKFQVGVAQGVSGSCSGVSFVFVGPDQTADTFFTASSAIPISTDGIGFENPGQCLRYKAYLSTSDFSQTPMFEEITFNYSP